MADETKDYFRQPDTVTQWWFPEDPAHPLYAHFQAQQRWVLAQAPWAGQRVLDVSTGKGRFAINFARAGAQVTALDIAPQMLERARAAAGQAGVTVGFVQGDAENLPFATGAYDVVVCMEAIMHVPHPQQLVNEMARVARHFPGVLVEMEQQAELHRGQFEWCAQEVKGHGPFVVGEGAPLHHLSRVEVEETDQRCRAAQADAVLVAQDRGLVNGVLVDEGAVGALQVL